MRIALLTHHWVPNFGANLQAYSIYRFLRLRGHDVRILNYRASFHEERYRKKVCLEQITVHNDFCERYLNLSPILRSEMELVDYCNESKFNTIIVGSDVVFRMNKEMTTPEGTFPNVFWLMWISALKSPVRTAALAGSCSGSMYHIFPKNIKQGIRKALGNFNYISVRDRWTKLMFYLISRGKCRPDICPDPVSVLNEVSEIGYGHFMEPGKKHKRYILLSAGDNILNNEWVREFVKISHRNNIEVYSLPNPEGELKLPVDSIISLPLNPLEWYEWIRHAAGYVGMRFHPVVSSVFNHVPFISIDNNSKRCLRYIPIRLRSKQYDLCKNIQGCRYCFTPKVFRRLVPSKAFVILRNWDDTKINTYICKAKRSFSNIMDRVLSS